MEENKDTVMEQPVGSGKINWQLRLKDPKFWIGIVVTIILCACSYASIDPSTLTTWGGVFTLLTSVVTNPYLLALVAWNIYNYSIDPTTKGITDSEKALKYKK